MRIVLTRLKEIELRDRPLGQSITGMYLTFGTVQQTAFISQSAMNEISSMIQLLLSDLEKDSKAEDRRSLENSQIRE
jgi:hypothetical protein